jgi:hypothetical protein
MGRCHHPGSPAVRRAMADTPLLPFLASDPLPFCSLSSPCASSHPRAPPPPSSSSTMPFVYPRPPETMRPHQMWSRRHRRRTLFSVSSTSHAPLPSLLRMGHCFTLFPIPPRCRNLFGVSPTAVRTSSPLDTAFSIHHRRAEIKRPRPREVAQCIPHTPLVLGPPPVRNLGS